MKDGVRQGEGKQHYLDGGYYKGAWFNDKRHGVGKLKDAKGKVLKGGTFVDDIPPGGVHE